ncbi:hypothetical protein EVA_20680 [gut metagenome]|uniref:Uncharacterized protein n=1 Tax=gut metagenome TaxID=749906 RepID=J9FNN9_9ZZZZ
MHQTDQQARRSKSRDTPKQLAPPAKQRPHPEPVTQNQHETRKIHRFQQETYSEDLANK